MKDNFHKKNLEQIKTIIQKEKSLINSPFVDLSDPQTETLNIQPDPTVVPGQFRPHPKYPRVYFAHPNTIQAVRKDVFTLGDDMDLYKDERTCISCKMKWDTQFWIMCPTCLGKLED